MTDDGEKIIGLRRRIEQAGKEVARLEALAEAAQQRVEEGLRKLVEMGYAEGVDVEAAVRQEVETIEAGLDVLEAEIEELRAGTTA